jgi:hypothetical protein
MDTHTHPCSRSLRDLAIGLACGLAAVAPACAPAAAAPVADLRIVSVEALPQGAQVSILLGRALALLPTDVWLEFPDGRRVDADLVTTRESAGPPAPLPHAVARSHVLRFRYPTAGGQRVGGVQLHVAPSPEDALVQTLATPVAALAPPPAGLVAAPREARVAAVPPRVAPPGVVAAAASTPADELATYVAGRSDDPAPAAAVGSAAPVRVDTGAEGDAFSRWLAAGGVAALVAGVVVLLLLRRNAGARIDDRSVAFPPAPPPRAPALPPAAPPQVPASPTTPRRTTRVGEYDFDPPSPGRPSALLHWCGGPRLGHALGIEAVRVTIGSERSCDLALVDDDFVSGLHAEIRYEAGSLYLIDRESRNGSFLNGERVTSLPRPLQRGDELRFGTTVLRLVDPYGTTPATAGQDEGAVR